MDLQLFSSLIKELILKNDKVYLPKLGSFITDTAPAYYSENNKVINPPYRRLFFRSKEMQDDGLLVNLYAKKEQLSVEEASNKIDSFIDTLVDRLSVKKSIVLDDFGTLKVTPENTYFFVAKNNLDIFPDMKGLNPISIGQLSQISRDKDKPIVDLPGELLENNNLNQNHESSTNIQRSKSNNMDFANQRQEEMQNNNYGFNRRFDLENNEDNLYSRQVNNKNTPIPKTVLSQKNTKILLITMGIIILSIIFYSLVKKNINNILYTPEELELIHNNHQ